MKVSQIIRLIESLGKAQDDIHVEGVNSQGDLIGLYEGDDTLALSPEPGVEMSFWAEGKVFKALNFTLIKTFEEEDNYTGDLPPPFRLSMNKAEMHEALGAPVESRGPLKMPQPLGQTGGWDYFFIDQEKYPDVRLLLQYTESFDVFGLVFTLGD